MKLLLLLMLGAILPTSSYPVTGAGSNSTTQPAVEGTGLMTTLRGPENTTTESPATAGPTTDDMNGTEDTTTEDTTTEDTNTTYTEAPSNSPDVKNTGTPNSSENNTELPNNNGMRTFNQANNGRTAGGPTTTQPSNRSTTTQPSNRSTTERPPKIDSECQELDCDNAEDLNKRTIWIVSGVVSGSVLIGICLLAYLRCYKESSQDDTKSTTYTTNSTLHPTKYTELGQSEANCLQDTVLCDDTVIEEGDEEEEKRREGDSADLNGDGGPPQATDGDTGDNSPE